MVTVNIVKWFLIRKVTPFFILHLIRRINARMCCRISSVRSIGKNFGRFFDTGFISSTVAPIEKD
jgi:hypothetical protein